MQLSEGNQFLPIIHVRDAAIVIGEIVDLETSEPFEIGIAPCAQIKVNNLVQLLEQHIGKSIVGSKSDYA